MRHYRWGILATGWMAEMFVEDLLLEERAKIVAVGSRTLGNAKRFAERFNIPKYHGSYEALVNDPDVDIIYIASPHPFHLEHMTLSLSAGKPTLCEKPFNINAKQTRQAIDLARQNNAFLMEAMWSRFMPIMAKVRELIASGCIGKVQLLSADFGFCAEKDPLKRWFNPDLGGGALLDVGIYPISLASMLFGKPESINTSATMSATGVDQTSSFIFRYGDGAQAILAASLMAETSQEAWIIGEQGKIHLPKSWWMAEKLYLHQGDDIQTIAVPKRGIGYGYQASAVMRALDNGLLESPLMPLSESLEIMQTMDAIRQQWGMHYPQED